jgi:hypothetical protein
MYYLGVDNCVYTDAGEKMLCGVKDFEITVEKKIYAISDGSKAASNLDTFVQDNTTLAWYCMYDKYRGLTLIKD